MREEGSEFQARDPDAQKSRFAILTWECWDGADRRTTKEFVAAKRSLDPCPSGNTASKLKHVAQVIRSQAVETFENQSD